MTDYNTGDYNTGYNNTGDYNTGDYNSGHYNSGHYNSGYYNSGHCNSGYYNSGNRNSGHYNSGYYNTGNRNSGFFCTETPQPMFFDAPWNGSWEEAYALIPYLDLPVCCEWISETDMTDAEKKEHPNYEDVGGYLRSNPLPLTEAFPVAWEKANAETRQRFLDLPNFDADKFLQITGVDVREKTKTESDPVPDEIVILGRRYRLVEERDE